MKYLSTAMLGTVALLTVHCTDGSTGLPAKSGGASGTASGGAPATGGAPGSGGSGQTGSGGSVVASGGSTGNSGGSTGNSGGSTGNSGGSTGNSGGSTGVGTGGSGTGTGGGSASGGAPGTGGAVAGTGGAAGGSTGLRSGPFKMLVMSSALEFPHDTIPTMFKLLEDLGKATAPERTKIAGLGADTTWTVDRMGSTPSAANYFSEITADNLKNYEMFFSNNPTGPVFTQAPQGATKKMIFQEWWTNGGGWAGQHSASDFEKTNGGQSWAWWHDNIDGAYFVDHDNPNTNGTITWQPDFINHPIVKGLPSPYSSGEEWYLMNRNVEAVAGFKVLGKVQVTNSSKGTAPRPAVWINENPKGGRAFYTIKGHSMSTYSEAAFRDLMLRGILWAVHRLPGGN